MTKLLKTLNEKIEVSIRIESYHKQNFHYYQGRTDALEELLRLEKEVE